MIVTVDEVKTHLRIQYDEEDAYLTSLIAQAQVAAEDYCRTQFPDSAPESVRLAVLLMVGFYYENRDIPDMTTYKAMRMAFDSLLYTLTRLRTQREPFRHIVHQDRGQQIYASVSVRRPNPARRRGRARRENNRRPRSRPRAASARFPAEEHLPRGL